LIPRYDGSNPRTVPLDRRTTSGRVRTLSHGKHWNCAFDQSQESGVACPRFEPTIRQVSEFRRTIGGNIADLRRVGKSGSGLSLPNLYDFARIPSIFCDPLRSMVAPRQRERMNSPHKHRRKFGETVVCARSRKCATARRRLGDSQIEWLRAYRSIRTNLPLLAARFTPSMTLSVIKPSYPETNGFSSPLITLQNCRI
jgi:hypothetical protein